MNRTQTLAVCTLAALCAWPAAPATAQTAPPPAAIAAPKSMGATAKAAEPAKAQTLNLEQILALAIERNPGLAQSDQSVKAAEARVTQAFSGYLPQLSAKSAYNRNWYESASFAAASGGTSNEYDYYQQVLSLSQYVYDFGATTGTVDQSRHNLTAARQQRFTTMAQLIQSVTKAYYDVLLKADLVQVNQESLRVQDAHLEQARALFEAGLRPKIDVTKGEVDRAKSRLNLITARYNLLTSRLTLEQQLGGPPAPGAYELAPEERQPKRPFDPLGLVDQAKKARPELADAVAQIKAADASITAAQGNYFPSLNLGGSYTWQNVEFPLLESWQAGATLNWALFSGMKTQGQVNEARANLLKAKALMRERELQVSKDVAEAYLKVNEALESIDTSREGLRQAEENMELAEGRYRSGAGDAIEYSDAELTLTQARSLLLQAIYSYWQSVADLDFAVGQGLANQSR
ncbi:MAG: TolC family protein [Thermodesulfobacteriota bacterium]